MASGPQQHCLFCASQTASGGAAGGLSTEDLPRMIRKQQRAMKRKQREEDMKRLHMAQDIQRQLQEVEIRQKEVESRGIYIEKHLRGEIKADEMDGAGQG